MHTSIALVGNVHICVTTASLADYFGQAERMTHQHHLNIRNKKAQ